MTLLFAQMPPESAGSGFSMGWLGILAALSVACLILSWSYESSKRRHERHEWEHTERLRMIEMGMPVTPRESSWAKAFLCSVIGGVVPLIAFGSTYIAHERPGSADELWIVPALVSGASVLAASLLAGHLFRPKAPSIANIGGSRPMMKPIHDPDAFDVVGSRG